jgi:hypothetical protein
MYVCMYDMYPGSVLWCGKNVCTVYVCMYDMYPGSVLWCGNNVCTVYVCMYVKILTGYVVSMMATNALGIDRTYFAAELGLVEPKWITQFPYGYAH